MARGESVQPGEYRLAVHVCIFNEKGEMLIQQRQPFKDGWPNMWDLSVGGCAQRGDTSQDAAEREAAEELGLHLDLQGIRPHITVNFYGGFDDIYLLEKEVDIDRLNLQYEEVQKVKWASVNEICAKIEEGTFIPYYPSLIRLLFDMRKQYGGYRA